MNKERITFFAVVLGLIVTCSLQAQTIILKQTVPDQLEDDDADFGPNRRRFNHTFVGFGFAVGGLTHLSEDLVKIKPMSSFSIYSGGRSYRKWNRFLAGVLDSEFSYGQFVYNVKKIDDTQLPIETVGLNAAKYWFGKWGLSWNLHINFKPKRGNQLGTYLGLGGYGNWLAFRRFSAKYDTDLSNMSGNARVGLSKMKFVEKWEYGPMLRFGRTNYCIFAKYRLNDLFDYQRGVWEFTELPRLTVGVNLFPGNI